MAATDAEGGQAKTMAALIEGDEARRGGERNWERGPAAASMTIAQRGPSTRLWRSQQRGQQNGGVWGGGAGRRGCTCQERKWRVHGCRKGGGGVTHAQSKRCVQASAGLDGGSALSLGAWLQRKGTLWLLVLEGSCCFKWVVCAPLAYEVSMPYDCSVR
jgi:hypothetical protein